MSAYFLDSSALVKRYVTETGSAWIQSLTSSIAGNKIIIARITWVEVVSALSRRQREGGLLPTSTTKAIHALRYDLDTQYQVIELDRALAEAAGRLIEKHPLRAYDAVQLASALRVRSAFARAQSLALTFLTADDRLIAIAQAEGLLTDNPKHHP